MTYYEILEISEKASQEVIRMAYKALCKKYHPDVYQGDKSYAEEQMKKINEAYITLSDELKKKEYDDSLNNKKQSKHSTYSENKQEHTATNMNALIKRGFMALEDGEWIKADNFFEQALNQDAESAEAYLGKLMIELQVKIRDDLKYCSLPFVDNNNYKRALRFADESLRNYLVSTIQHINERKRALMYNKACKLMETAQSILSFEGALELFEKIADYKDSSLKISECKEKIKIIKERIDKEEQLHKEKSEKMLNCAKIIIPIILVTLILTLVIKSEVSKSNKYNNALSLIEDEKYVEALDILTKIDDYRDAKDNITLCEKHIIESNYQKALLLIKENKFVEAYELLQSLASNNYKDSKVLMETYKKSFEKALFNHKLKTADFGTVVTFGSYEQDDNLENGKEPIDWIIIDRNETSTMLISLDVIEYKKFSSNYDDKTWEKSSIRRWLNSEFFNALFAPDEQNYILDTTVVPDKKLYSTSPDQGNTTIDKIFLLSEKEFLKYEKVIDMDCAPTRYVNALGGSTGWWLRSTTGNIESCIDSVDFVGDTSYRVHAHFYNIKQGVRPVIRVSFN